MGYAYIALTIVLTVYGQVVIKWQVSLAGAMPSHAGEKVAFLLGVLLKPWVVSAFVAAFLASIAWMAAMTKFDLSYAYPFMSLNFVLVVALSAWFFHEAITLPRVIGLLLIVVGIFVGSQTHRAP
jgi:multidrug transporter EmrE-like cation transporter